MYYFAYGSNMKLQRMKDKCPKAKFIKKVFLRGYKFIYDGFSTNWNGGVANIVQSNNATDEVWGALYEISKNDLTAIRGFIVENVPCIKTSDGYTEHELDVNDDDKKSYHALVYLRTGEKQTEPSKKYRKAVIEGAKDCSLPKEYIGKNL